jgi:predicted ATPase
MDTERCFVINIIGGPGAGKSTLYSFIYAKMKIRKISVEQVQEFAKKLVWAGNFEELDNQYHVSKCQYNELKSVYGKVRFVITDGSLIHGLYYNQYNPTNVCDRIITERKILEMYHSFNNINILLTRGAFPYEQAGRIQNAEEALHVDKTLVEIMDQNNISYRAFSSDETQVDSMIEYILSCADSA